MPQGKRKRQPKKSSGSRAMMLIPIVGVALILAGIFMLYNPSPATAPAASVVDYHDEEGIPYPEVPRISPAGAKAAFDAGTVIIVDVRSQGEYDTARVSNAVSLPLADLDARYRELPQDMEIITYCT